MSRDLSSCSSVLSEYLCRKYQFLLSNFSSVCKFYPEKGETIRFSFSEDDREFEEEKPFIREVLMELLSRKLCDAKIVNSQMEYLPYEGVFIRSKKVLCGNLSIDVVPVTGKLIDYVDEVVDEYNKGLRKSKVYKLTIGDKYGRTNDGKNS